MQVAPLFYVICFARLVSYHRLLLGGFENRLWRKSACRTRNDDSLYISKCSIHYSNKQLYNKYALIERIYFIGHELPRSVCLVVTDDLFTFDIV